MAKRNNYKGLILTLILTLIIVFESIFIAVSLSNSDVKYSIDCVPDAETAEKIAALYWENIGMVYDASELHTEYHKDTNMWHIDPEYYQNKRSGIVTAGYTGLYINKKTGRINLMDF